MTAKKPAALATALAWLRAVDSRDRKGMLDLTHPDIEMAGPHGVSKGEETLGIWFRRVIMNVELRRAFEKGRRALVLHHIRWVNPNDGTLVGEAEAASVFDVDGGLVARYERDDDPAGALARHGFAEADEQKLPA
jgi:hypothetical protein